MYLKEKEKLREDSREVRDEKRRMLHSRARCARTRSTLSSDALRWPSHLAISDYTRTHIHMSSFTQPALTECLPRTFRQRDKIGETILICSLYRSGLQVSSIIEHRGRTNCKAKTTRTSIMVSTIVFHLQQTAIVA